VQLCEEVAQAAGGVYTHEHQCMLTGVLTAAMTGGGVEGCEQAYVACLQEDPDPMEDECSLDEMDELRDCDAPLGDLERCMNDMFAQLSQLFGGLTCDSDPQELAGLDEKPASCQALEERCPEIFAEDEE